MIDLHLTTKKGIAFQRRETSLFSRNSRRQNRQGQTLVEYALIVAYISVTSMQAMTYLGFIAQKQYVYVNCVAIVANTNNPNLPTLQNQQQEMTAVTNYLAQANTWRNAQASWVASANAEISGKMSSIIYSS